MFSDLLILVLFGAKMHMLGTHETPSKKYFCPKTVDGNILTAKVDTYGLMKTSIESPRLYAVTLNVHSFVNALEILCKRYLDAI